MASSVVMKRDSLDDDLGSFSIVSTLPDVVTIYTPTGTDDGSDGLFHFDHDDNDESYHDDHDTSRDWDSQSSSSTSVSPSLFEHEIAFGRSYHAYKRGRYPMPNDDLERQREETKHTMMLQLTDGHLFYADIGDYPQKIIDIGTGTGIWAIDVADLYPSASVIGTDLSPIQPTWVPINSRMFVEDCEDPEWLHGSGFDLVHYRSMAGVVQDLDGLLAKAFPHIREGGWVKFQEIIPNIRCDDGSMKHDDPLRLFSNVATQGLQEFGFSAVTPAGLESALDRAGFTNIQVITKKVPISIWPRDKNLQTLGLFMKATILDSLTALAAKPLAALDIPASARRELVQQVKSSLADDSIHRYVEVCFCFGQKKGRDVISLSETASIL